jgi:hypothetical protein
MTTPTVVEVFAYPDVERVVRAILLPLGVRVVTALPPEFEPPLVWVQRTGGGPDPADVTDEAVVTIHTFGSTRAFAIDLSTVVGATILAAGGRSVEVPDYGRVLVDWTSIAVGSTEIQDLDPDDRRFDVDYGAAMRRHKLALTLE